MKYLVISDIHGSAYYANKIEEIYNKENPDKIIILGDLYYHGPRNNLSQEYNPMKVAEVLNKYKDKIIAVRGNCDAEIDEQISEFKIDENTIIDINGKKTFISHGHRYNMKQLPPVDDLDMVLYGHFHVGFIKEADGIIFANPGSISLPRMESMNSYLIIDNNEIQLKDINGNVIESIKL